MAAMVYFELLQSLLVCVVHKSMAFETGFCYLREPFSGGFIYFVTTHCHQTALWFNYVKKFKYKLFTAPKALKLCQLSVGCANFDYMHNLRSESWCHGPFKFHIYKVSFYI